MVTDVACSRSWPVRDRMMHAGQVEIDPIDEGSSVLICARGSKAVNLYGSLPIVEANSADEEVLFGAITIPHGANGLVIQTTAQPCIQPLHCEEFCWPKRHNIRGKPLRRLLKNCWDSRWCHEHVRHDRRATADHHDPE